MHSMKSPDSLIQSLKHDQPYVSRSGQGSTEQTGSVRVDYRSSSYSLKSTFVISHPTSLTASDATFSVNSVFNALDLSVQSSYRVERLKVRA